MTIFWFHSRVLLEYGFVLKEYLYIRGVNLNSAVTSILCIDVF